MRPIAEADAVNPRGEERRRRVSNHEAPVWPSFETPRYAWLLRMRTVTNLMRRRGRGGRSVGFGGGLAADPVEKRVQRHRDQCAEQNAGLQQRVQVVRQVLEEVR